MVKNYPCIVCKKRTKSRDRRPPTLPVRKFLQKELGISPAADDTICSACRTKFYKLSKSQISATGSHSNTDSRLDRDTDYAPPLATSSTKPICSPPSVTLKISTTSRSHSRCFVCKRPGPKLVSLSAEGRVKAFIEHNILINVDARCCPGHTSDGFILPIAVSTIHSVSSQSLLSRSAINDLLQKMRMACTAQQSSLSFDRLNESDYPSLTGLSREQFDDVCQHLSDKVKNTPVRSARTSIGLFLVKLYSGMSNKLLATIFGITKSSVRRAVSTVRQAFMRGFVPLYLGIEALTRDEIISQHTRPLAKSLFGAENSLILVLDGTYIYINKSNNFAFQRRTYSLHKGRPLIKPMVIVTTTGHFVAIIGPYLADYKNNDAAILNHMLRCNIDNFKDLLQEGDVFIVDRGFRDSLELLADLGIQAEMPTLLSKGQKQMSTEDANTSRLVTKIRWVVESANARIKRFRYLDHVMPNSQIPYIGDFVRIVCALSNKYMPPLSSPASVEKDEAIAAKMLAQCGKVNTLKQMVEEKKLPKRGKCWKQADEISLEGFPRMSEEQLRELTLGVYQLRLSSSYIQEHLDGNCDLYFFAEDPSLLCVKMQSRHVSSRNYMLWIRYTNDNIDAWYCLCRAGARVVGMCSHVSAIIWYLAYKRYEDGSSVGVRNWGDHLADAAVFEIDGDSTQSESEL